MKNISKNSISNMQRRRIVQAAFGAAAVSALPMAARGATSGSVVVVGGGMAGATVAKYLRLWSKGAIAVTLVDRNAAYMSNIMSSMVLSGQRTLASLRYSYDALKSKYGVQVLTDEVSGIDPVSGVVSLGSGKTLAADKIVLAPGMRFDALPGQSDPLRMPHAWQAGVQTEVLAKQLAAMPAGGTVVLTIPKVPYRCPPGPYERACLLADWLKAKKPGSKILVLDANPDIVVEKDNFSQAFFGLHASVLEYHAGVEISSVDDAQMMLYTNQGAVHGDVINLIPPQRAGKIVEQLGLATATGGRFAPVDVLSYQSTLASRIHVIGDSSATTQPKAGHIANQEAKVCADALVRYFAGVAPDPAPVTNSACFSTITRAQASWLNAVFQYDALSATMKPVAAAGAASSGWSSGNFEDMQTWFKALMSDTFA